MGERLTRASYPRYWLTCQQCRSDFQARRVTGRYCSPVCRVEAMRDRKTSAGIPRSHPVTAAKGVHGA